MSHNNPYPKCYGTMQDSPCHNWTCRFALKCHDKSFPGFEKPKCARCVKLEKALRYHIETFEVANNRYDDDRTGKVDEIFKRMMEG